MRRPAILVLAALMLLALAAPASALTTQRTWRGTVGKDGANGTHNLYAYTDGTGMLAISLRRLRANASYRIEIRKGTCSALGTTLSRPASAKTGATGAVTTTRHLSMTSMNAIWPPSRSGNIAVRYYNGSSIRCGNLRFNKATRIKIPWYAIDLPVVKSPDAYPYCNVGMYLKELSQPTEPGVSYIFGHARKGMFLPLLTASQTNNGAAMIGKTIYVYTNNNKRHQYSITQVRRHVSSIQDVFGVTAETLWVQTSEGPNFTYPKLIIVAKRVATVATTYAASHPTPHPVHC